MLQFKYMMFINFARTLCRVGVVWKKEEGYIFSTCFFLSASPFLIYKKSHYISLTWVGVKFIPIGFNWVTTVDLYQINTLYEKNHQE